MEVQIRAPEPGTILKTNGKENENVLIGESLYVMKTEEGKKSLIQFSDKINLWWILGLISLIFAVLIGAFGAHYMTMKVFKFDSS